MRTSAQGGWLQVAAVLAILNRYPVVASNPRLLHHMKLFACLMLLVCLDPLNARSAETASGRIWCLSLQFQQGTDSFGDTLDFSTTAGSPNGELEPYNGLTYISGFTLDISGQPITGTMQLNLPPFQDANSNGFSDFFESSQGVGASTSGTYTTPISTGSVTASWQRAAGSASGSCVLHLVDSTFGDLGSFNSVFALLEYTGPLLYIPGTNVVTGNLNLAQTGNTSATMQGPFEFVKVATNRFNLLILQAGSWTNESALSLTYTNALFAREPPWTTNYFGLVQFADGNPSTPAPDYLVWALSIDDTNDANHNGIPDFSDDPTSGPPPPALALSSNSTNLLVSLSGAVGHPLELQQASSLPATNWQTVVSITLTNNPQLIALPLPSATSAFWRAVAF